MPALGNSRKNMSARNPALEKKRQRAPSIAEARVYRALKKAIISGQFSPGSVLVQEELCREFGASRTPIRDALTHLQAEGLIVALPNKGVFVRELSPKDVQDIYDTRLLLESAAAKEAAGRVNTEELKTVLARMVQLQKKRDFSFDSVRAVGGGFHRLIVLSSGNRMMKDILDRMEALVEVSRIPFKECVERLEQINQEHINMVQALMRRDGEMAADLMKTHISLTREAHLKILMGTSRSLATAIRG
jgi:DNA-binding GntR family transcriptional regulator